MTMHIPLPTWKQRPNATEISTVNDIRPHRTVRTIQLGNKTQIQLIRLCPLFMLSRQK
jgi:hypothetical protein